MTDPNRARGAAAERRAARLLRRTGHLVVERNVRIGRDEIDLVAVRGGVVILVEVRFRAEGLAAAALSIDGDKAQALRRGALAYLARERLRGVPARIDRVLVTRDDGAWRLVHEPAVVPLDARD